VKVSELQISLKMDVAFFHHVLHISRTKCIKFTNPGAELLCLNTRRWIRWTEGDDGERGSLAHLPVTRGWSQICGFLGGLAENRLWFSMSPVSLGKTRRNPVTFIQFQEKSQRKDLELLTSHFFYTLTLLPFLSRQSWIPYAFNFLSICSSPFTLRS
jgi:hypothetical protein